MAQRKSKYQPIPTAEQPDHTEREDQKEPVFTAPQPYADEICLWISEGKTLREYCRQKGKPNFQRVYEWMEKDVDFQGRFARAREVGHDAISEECFDIADDATNDWVERHDKRGGAYTAFDDEHVQRSKLRIYTRLQLLAKWNPKKYGEKVQQQVTGADGGPVLVLDYRTKRDDEDRDGGK